MAGPRALLQTLATLCVMFVLHGCMSAPPAPPPDEGYTRDIPRDWANRKERLKSFNTWELQGKIAVHQPERNDSGVIRYWEQIGEQFELEVSSSFMGMGTTRLEGSPGFLVVTDSGGEQYFSEDPAQLLKQTLGWEVPLDAVAYWVRGLPAPHSTDYELFFDADGQLGYLRQMGWEVYYEGHEPLNGLPPMPRRMTATHDDARVRLVITNWQRTDR